eukprot:TRINITY_DN59899_c0_g1_i1.p3 TRINITY_DN59899_c0_g1~~TRINITY_DN59899_c0_g1_i1.p3  ORF type:complete len:128 (+),score=21.63 TRINITY_DN59899_c0_g1_i1:49-432(+)
MTLRFLGVVFWVCDYKLAWSAPSADDLLDDGKTDHNEFVASHPHGEHCIEVAEELENNYGLFDYGLSEHKRTAISDRLHEFAREKYGTASPHFEGLLSKMFERVSKHSSPMGVSDVCRMLFKSHDEL